MMKKRKKWIFTIYLRLCFLTIPLPSDCLPNLFFWSCGNSISAVIAWLRLLPTIETQLPFYFFLLTQNIIHFIYHHIPFFHKKTHILYIHVILIYLHIENIFLMRIWKILHNLRSHNTQAIQNILSERERERENIRPRSNNPAAVKVIVVVVIYVCKRNMLVIIANSFTVCRIGKERRLNVSSQRTKVQGRKKSIRSSISFY